MRVIPHIAVVAAFVLFCSNFVSLAAPNQSEQTILSGTHFKPSTAELTAESDRVLKEVLAMLVANPDLGLRIKGHTDNKGSAQDNLELSKRRAQAVLDWLVQNGVDAHRLKVEDFGDSRPTAASDTPENRELNNQVELATFTLKKPSAFFPVTQWEFDPVVDGAEVIHDFVIQNKGNASLNIARVKTA
jgi:hypothetical protein